MFPKKDICKKQSVWYRYILVIFFLVFLIAACSSSDETKTNALVFAVDSTLLGESFVDSISGLFLQAPTEWQIQSDATIRQVQAGIEADPDGQDRPVPEILTLFSLQEHNAYLVVGLYSPDLLPEDQDSLVRWQKEGLQKRFADSDVSFFTFSHNRLEFEQLLVIGAEFAVIKLFIRRKDQAMYQLEYVAHRSWYEAHLRTIESSIGSISFRI